MFKHPLKHVRRYLKQVEEQLGGGDDIPYRLVDYTRKIYWGKQRTLQRVHVLLHEILRLMSRKLLCRRCPASEQSTSAVSTTEGGTLRGCSLTWRTRFRGDAGAEKLRRSRSSQLTSRRSKTWRRRLARHGSSTECSSSSTTSRAQGEAKGRQGCAERPAQPVRVTSFQKDLLELVGASTGSFGRFWREYRSVSSRIRASSSVPQEAECTKLFPSILPWHWLADLTQPASSGRGSEDEAEHRL